MLVAEFGGGTRTDAVDDGARTRTPAHGGLPDRLASARSLEDVARAVLDAAQALPGAMRAGLALTEGGGRRLLFTASDRHSATAADWCHIDAYEDVPLTAVVRTGRPVIAALDRLEARYAAFADHHRRSGAAAVAAVPLPTPEAPIGGLVVYFDDRHGLPPHPLLETLGQQAATAVRRVRRVRPAPRGGRGARRHRAERVATLSLAADPRAVATARRFVRDQALAWGVPEDAADVAQLLTSEIVTNAVTHAQAPSELCVSLDRGRLLVELSDGGTDPGGSAVGDDDPMRVHGRGLMLVDALATTWGTRRGAEGTTAWFTLQVGP